MHKPVFQFLSWVETVLYARRKPSRAVQTIKSLWKLRWNVANQPKTPVLISVIFTISIYKFGLSVCLFVCLFVCLLCCLFVCLFVFNKRQNCWTDRAQIFCGTPRDPREGLWKIKISNICLHRNSIFIKFLKILKIHEIFCENPRIIFVLFYDVHKYLTFWSLINLPWGP